MDLSIIAVLLSTAMSFLLSVQTPGTPVELKQQAITMAVQAVELANKSVTASLPKQEPVGSLSLPVYLTPQPTVQSSTQIIQATPEPTEEAKKVETVKCKVVEPTNTTAWYSLTCDSSYDTPVHLRSLIMKAVVEEGTVNVTFGINSKTTGAIEKIQGEKTVEILCPAGYCKILPNVSEQRFVTWKTNFAFPVKLEKYTVSIGEDEWVEVEL